MQASQRLPNGTELSALASRKFDDVNDKVSWWERWLQQPPRSKLHAFLFQLHFCIGAVAGAYLTLMSHRKHPGISGPVVPLEIRRS